MPPEAAPPQSALSRYNGGLQTRGLSMHHSINSMRFILSIFALSIFGFAIADTAQAAPASKPATRPAVSKPTPAQSPEAKGNLAVAKAVAALKKEFADHQKDPIAEIRKESDYFVKEPDGDVTVESILNALERRVGD